MVLNWRIDAYKMIKMQKKTLTVIRFFCAGAILTAAVVELFVPSSDIAAVVASPFGGVVATAAALKLSFV